MASQVLAGLKELTLSSDNGSPTSSTSASRPEVRPSLTAARVVLTASGSKPTRAAAATSQARLSALARMAPMGRGLPADGPSPSMPTTASMTVKQGLTRLQMSNRAWLKSPTLGIRRWYSVLRGLGTAPKATLTAPVSPVRVWVLSLGTVMTTSASATALMTVTPLRSLPSGWGKFTVERS